MAEFINPCYCTYRGMNLWDSIKFALKMDFLLLAVALPQWMLLSTYTLDEHISYALFCFMAALVTLSTLQKWTSMREDWTSLKLTFGCSYELINLGLGISLMNIDEHQLMLLVAISLLISGSISVISYCIARNCHYFPNPFTLPTLAGLGLMLIVAELTLGTIFDPPYCPDLAILVFVVSVMIIMFAAMVKHVNRSFFTKDYALMLGIELYVNYVLILLACFICYQRVQPNPIDGTNGGRHA